MRNKAFKKLSPAEKELKILGALDKKTEGLLLPKELLTIASECPATSSIPSSSTAAILSSGVYCPWITQSVYGRS